MFPSLTLFKDIPTRVCQLHSRLSHLIVTLSRFPTGNLACALVGAYQNSCCPIRNVCVFARWQKGPNPEKDRSDIVDTVDPRLRCSLDKSHTTDKSFDLVAAAAVDTAFQDSQHRLTILFPCPLQDILHRLEYTRKNQR